MATDGYSGDLTPGNGAYATPETPSDLPGPDYGAPRYFIPHRHLAAVEVPAVVQNIDRAVKAFGRVPSLNHVSNSNSATMNLHVQKPNAQVRLWRRGATLYHST